MKISSRILALALVALAAMPIVGRAQLTYYTNANTGSGTFTLASGGYTAIQTFTGFADISSITWQLTNNGGTAATASFNAYIVGWSGATAAPSSLQAFGLGNLSTGVTPIAAGGTTSLTFTASLPALSVSQNYALLLSYSSGDQSFVANLGANPGDGFFSSGGAGSAFTSSDLAGFQAALEGTGTGGFGSAIDTGLAYTMSVGIAATPAPEPKTAAAAIAALFVAVLVGRRVWQRNQLTPIRVTA